MVSFWGGIFTEAIGAMLDKMRSGRAGVQMENDQKLLSQLLPIFNDGLMMTKAPDMQVACYMALSVYVAKGNLSDNVITAMLEQVVAGWSSSTLRPGLVCLSILAHHRSSKQLPWKAAKALLKIPDLTRVLAEVSLGQRTDRLVSGLCLACVERLAKRGDTRGLEIVPLLFDPSILTEKQMISIFKALLSAAHKLSAENDPDGLARKQLSSVILRLSQTSGTTSAVVEKALSAADVDLDDVELRLQTTIRPKQLQQQITEEKSTKTTASKPVESFRQSLEQVAKKRYDLKQSCLSPRAGDVVKDLCAIFESFSLEGAKDTLDEEPIFRECDDRFYVTFFARIWCGPYPSFVRSAALEHVKRRVKGGHPSGTDFQSIYVYLLVALGDTSKKVRRSAADLVTVLSSLWTANGAQTKVEWPGKQLYGEAEQRALSTDVSGRLLQTVLMPSLEECVMHESHIDAVIQQLLDGGSTSSTSDRASGRGDRWAQADLSNIFNFLASHISQTPLLAVKKRILFPLVRVKNTGGTRTNQLLLPILEWWSKLGVAEVAERCREESIEQSAMDTLVADIVTANDKAGLEYLLEIVKMPRSRDRPGLVRAVFGRLESLFSSMKSETKASTAMSLLEVSLEPQFDGSTVSEEAAGFLKTAGLSTPILSRFLRSIQNSVATVPLDSPPSKRRKTNSSDHAGPAVAESTPDLERALRRATFILELVHDSNPIQHPELFNDLFDTLSDLQHLRSVMGTDLGYLQNLVLSSLLAMMPAYRSDRTLKIDPSGGQGDLLVNCIQKASSPSVQNTALLLVANLATIAPDLVLHSVMPIFAFMESSVLRQNDNYSAHVITQTIKEIIPPLINSLRKGKRNPVTGASELLVSFVTAYEHVPSHRRQGLFKALVETLGPEDFMFAVLAMLVDRYESSETAAFALGLLSSFGVDVQLQTLIRLIDLIAEVFKPKAGIAGALLGAGHDGELDPEEVAETQLGLVAHLLRNRSLASQMAKITAKDDMDASKIRELYASLLERVLIIANTVKPRKSSLHDLCGVALENLLNMLSIGEFIKAVEDLLDRSDTGLRQKVLRALEGRIDREKPGDAQSSTVLLAFLPHLTAVIRDSNDIIYKHTAVGCVDKISEKYGRKDLETVSAAAETIASDNCLGQDDQRLRVISLLCLASLVDVLQDGIVPVLPSAIPKALVYLKESLVADGLQEGLHNSVYAFFTALAEHIPYMVSEAYLVQLMSASNLSAEASWSAEGENARKQCFEFLCKKVDAKVMFHALEKNWAPATSAGYLVRPISLLDRAPIVLTLLLAGY